MSDKHALSETAFNSRRKAEQDQLHRQMMRRRWSNYVVPTDEKLKHVNPWIRTIVSYDLNNI